MDTVLLLSLLAGFATGALSAWVLARAQFRRELTESISTHQATVSAAQALFHQTTRRLGEVQGELMRTREDLDRARADSSTLRESLARTTAELEHQHQILPQQMAVLEQAQTQLRDSFQALAGSALKSSNEEFLKLAHERLSGLQKDAASEIARKHQAFDELVSPIRDVLHQVDQKLGEVEKNRVETGAEISSLLEAIGRSQTQLRAETTNLVRALRTPTVRGRWGEMQLRRVVEMAGMLEYLRLPRAVDAPRPRGSASGRTCWCGCPAGAPWSWTPRCRSKPISTPRTRPTTTRARPSSPITRARCATT